MQIKQLAFKKFTNVLEVFDVIYSILSLYRAGGFTVTATMKAETHLKNYLKLVLYHGTLILFIFQAFTENYSNTGFVLLDSGINYAMIIVACCGMFLELRYFRDRFQLWNIALKYHECDVLVFTLFI